MPQVVEGRGFSVRQVYVKTLIPERSVAQCQVVGNNTIMEIPVLPVFGPHSPRMGETWMVENQTTGSWMFSGLIKAADATTTPDILVKYGPPQATDGEFVGQLWADIQQTDGASLWSNPGKGQQKSVLDGCTPWTPFPATVTSSYLSLDHAVGLRDRNSVSLQIRGTSSVTSSSSGAIVGFSIPSGFTPMTYLSRSIYSTVVSSSGAVVGWAQIKPSTQSVTITLTASGSVNFTINWITHDPWPTS